MTATTSAQTGRRVWRLVSSVTAGLTARTAATRPTAVDRRAPRTALVPANRRLLALAVVRVVSVNVLTRGTIARASVRYSTIIFLVLGPYY